MKQAIDMFSLIHVLQVKRVYAGSDVTADPCTYSFVKLNKKSRHHTRIFRLVCLSNLPTKKSYDDMMSTILQLLQNLIFEKWKKIWGRRTFFIFPIAWNSED